MPLRRVLPLGVALLAAGCGGSHTVYSTNGNGPRIARIRPPAPTSLRFSTASNRAFARQDVRKLLRIVVLPPGARQVTAVPKTAPSWFRHELPRHFAGAAIAHRVWIVDEPVKSVMAYVQTNARPRPRPEVPFRKNLSRIGTRPSRNYIFPPIPGRSWSRWLNLDMLALPGGKTVVVTQAGDSWQRTPPSSDELPKGVKRVDIKSRFGGKRPNVLVHVRKPYDVGSIVAAVNGLGSVSGDFFCLDVFYSGPTVTLTFRGADGSVLARARVRDILGSGRSGPCDPLELTIGSRRAVPLIGSDLLLRLEQRLGVDLSPPTPSGVAVCLRAHGWKTHTAHHRLTARREGVSRTVTFHPTGKVTTSGHAPPGLARCVRHNQGFRLGGFR